MKQKIFLIVSQIALCWGLHSQTSVATDDFELRIEKFQYISKNPIIPWMQEIPENWSKVKWIAQLKSDSSELSANIACIMTDLELVIRVEVKDNINYNNEDWAADIWKGDGIQIAIDAQGQGSGNMPSETSGMVGDDDCAFGLSFTSTGPKANAWFFSNEKHVGVMDSKLFSVRRDEKKQLTIYQVSIPFEYLNTVPALYPELGFAVQVNDVDYADKKQERLRFGKGADGVPRPGLFQRFSYGTPLEEFFSAAVINDVIWNAGDEASILFAVASKKTHTLSALAGGNSFSVDIKPDNTLAVKRYHVKLKAKHTKYTFSYRAWLDDMTPQKLQVKVPDAQVREFNELMDTLILKNSSNDLFLRHLLSVKALCNSEWAKAKYNLNIDPRFADETFQYIENIANGFWSDAALWETYLKRERSLFMAYISPRDGTLQYYSLDLPKNWDRDKAFPLFVELHGAGNPHTLNGLSSSLGSSGSALDLYGYVSKQSVVQKEGWGYHIMPWGRGNSRYRDIGETDVWEAFDDVHANFKIDKDRRYLFGFSMGGGGTWSIGLRTPDIWASIGIFSGGLWNEIHDSGLGRNVKNLPVYIWCGDKDFLFENVAKMKQLLADYNVKPFVKITPGLDHKFPDSIQYDILSRMILHKRQRPNQFDFVSDNDRQKGVWGITMERNLGVSGLPAMKCKIEGENLFIETTGTKGISIDPGAEGLQWNGNLKVYWNGKEEYIGQAKRIKIGDTRVDTW